MWDSLQLQPSRWRPWKESTRMVHSTRRCLLLVLNFVPASTVQEPQDQRQDQADDQRGHDWEVEAEIVALDDDVARQPTEPHPLQHRPQQANDDQHHTEDDEPATHGSHPFRSRPYEKLNAAPGALPSASRLACWLLRRPSPMVVADESNSDTLSQLLSSPHAGAP